MIRRICVRLPENASILSSEYSGWYVEIDGGRPYATPLTSQGWLQMSMMKGVEILDWNEIPPSLQEWLIARGELVH